MHSCDLSGSLVYPDSVTAKGCFSDPILSKNSRTQRTNETAYCPVPYVFYCRSRGGAVSRPSWSHAVWCRRAIQLPGGFTRTDRFWRCPRHRCFCTTDMYRRRLLVPSSIRDPRSMVRKNTHLLGLSRSLCMVRTRFFSIVSQGPSNHDYLMVKSPGIRYLSISRR